MINHVYVFKNEIKQLAYYKEKLHEVEKLGVEYKITEYLAYKDIIETHTDRYVFWHHTYFKHYGEREHANYLYIDEEIDDKPLVAFAILPMLNAPYEDIPHMERLTWI
jgi:effector-binding domain-containing protein